MAMVSSKVGKAKKPAASKPKAKPAKAKSASGTAAKPKPSAKQRGIRILG